LWRTNGPILRAIVENWQSEPRLRADAAAHLAGHDVTAVASGLTWLGERLYYLAACGIPPFDDENALVKYPRSHLGVHPLRRARAEPPGR